ncbi:hypothetical protein FB451DRAFT_1225648 [Mycena latifolia]|nr:hypothetical protein FB451DRAFT_1225648 [Mycena latifolia]
MQAVYSTTTDVKIHKAIRREWASFQAWLFEQRRRLEYRENELLSAAQRKRGKPKQADNLKQQIRGLQEEFLAVARGEWLARVRQTQLHLEHWVMTPDEKQVLQQTLGWTQKDMVDAYAREQAEMGPMYQRVDPVTLGTKEPPVQSTSKFQHPPVNENVPAYAKWAAELAKIPIASPRRPPKSPKSVELPALPLYFVGALLQGTDLDAVAASELEAFALRASEEKIREYYNEACNATLHFQRHLTGLDPSQREEAQEGFERHMRDLASGKEREWKALTVKELRKHQAAELERRVAQQRAMRPSPPRRREPVRHEFSDWDYVDDYDSPPQDYYPYHSPQTDYLQEYRSPRREYRETYQSPLLDSLETYNSPRRNSPRRVRRKPVPDDDYTRGGIRRPSTNDPVRSTAASKSTTAPTAARNRDWSSVRVDEVDLKSRSIPAPKKPPLRDGNGLVVRLDGTAKLPGREKLKKRKSENIKKEQTLAKTSGISKLGGSGRGPGRVFGGRVPDQEKHIPMAREAVLQPQTKSQPDHLRHRMGGPRFGLANDSLAKRALNRDGAQNGYGNPRSPPHLGPALKRVRFSPSTLSAGITRHLKRQETVKLNINDNNENQSRFYEGFDSRANSAAS